MRTTEGTLIDMGSDISRRRLLQAATGLSLGAKPLAQKAAERPNILVVLTDDHGQWASHCYGNRELATPNVDLLAETGALMQNAYTPVPSARRRAPHSGQAAFRDIPMETYAGPGKAIHLPPGDSAARHEQLAQYYAAVMYVDEQLGILIDELESSGDLANTLIVYTADHGHMNGHHGLYTKGNATAPQNFLEESIRIPCILRWPGRINAGRKHSFPVDHCDLFQTILDAAGARETKEAHGKRNSPGRSYLPLIGENATLDKQIWRDAQFCEYGNARMVRTDRRKLIVRYPPHAPRFGDELYDLADDPRETRNVIGEANNREIAKQLHTRLDAHFANHEEPEHSGRDILKRPRYNPNEPWRVAL